MSKAKLVLLLAAASMALLAARQGTPQLQEGTQVSEVALTAIGAEPFEVLQGPFDETRLTFQVPPDWQVLDGSSLNLSLQNFFSSFVPAQGEITQEDLVAGNISIALDGDLIYRSILSVNGEEDISIPLAAAQFTANQPTHELTIAWDASASCDLNLSSTILIDPESAIVLSHASTAFNPDLAQLPYPFFTHHALAEIGSVIVLPASASETQVAAALSTTAGLGRFAPEGKFQIAIEGTINADDLANKNLIFVGPVESFPSLQDILLPHRNDERLRLPGSTHSRSRAPPASQAAPRR